MAGAKIPTRRKKKRSSSPAPPTSTFTVRHVRTSQALGTSDAARRLGITPAALRRLARAGRLPATVDDHGRYHFAERVVAARAPSAPRARTPSDAQRRAKKKLLGAGKKAGKKARASRKVARASQAASLRKKRKVAAASAKAATAATAAKAATSATSRKKKKSERKPGKLAKKSKKVVAGKKSKRAGKKRPPAPAPPPRKKSKKKKRRAKKSKRPSRPPQPPEPRPGYQPGLFGVPVRSPGFVPAESYSAETPMPIDLAAKATGESLRAYVMARYKWEREGTHIDFYAHKHSFRETYGIAAWHDFFDWIVDEWDLEPYIFDRTALRDS